MSKNGFLKHLSLSGYKSINNVEIDFEDGLNIIIGKNAAGKTNFLSFLYKTLDFSFDDLFNFSSKLTFGAGSNLRIESSRTMEKTGNNGSFSLEKTRVTTKAYKNNVLLNEINDSLTGLDINHFFTQENHYLSTTFIKHGIPTQYDIVDKPFSYKIDKKGISRELLLNIFSTRTPFFIKNLMTHFAYLNYGAKTISKKSIKGLLSQVFNELNKIKDIVVQYSPIEDIRFNNNFNVSIENGKNEYTVDNLFLEFKTRGNWYPFSYLSDGTKRLFYVISEIAYKSSFNISKISIDYLENNNKELDRIILIEEPELGVHPHQLMKLMNFLKEEAKNKQIIISTHSPMAIDILNQDELNKIIIAYTNKQTDGTKLRHLDKNEETKAKKYIKEHFLSDFWKYSDLEK